RVAIGRGATQISKEPQAGKEKQHGGKRDAAIHALCALALRVLRQELWGVASGRRGNLHGWPAL
ncbi:MAG: hypothetical protein ACLGSH_02360, partial [Acidobacteriota bacterium]